MNHVFLLCVNDGAWLISTVPPSTSSSSQLKMAGYCTEYGDGLSAGGYCSSFVAADSMVFVAKKFGDVREYEASLKVLVFNST